MTGITDRMDLGYFPLQDHAAGQDGTPVSARQSLGGARITRMTDPTDGGTSAADSMIVYGRDNGMGTLGDVHPWLFWQTRDRGVRGAGSWAQCFGMLAVDADGYYNKVSGQPLRDDFYKNDTRYAAKDLNWPLGLPRVAKGALLLALPGTEESGQNDLAVSVDPRLVAPNVSGPAECGTTVVDMQPARELCMDNSITPGIGGRHARLQSLVRVIAVAEGSSLADLGGEGNVIALNHSLSGIDQLPGYGAIFAMMDQTVTGPTTGGPNRPTTGPTTPSGRPQGPITGPHPAQRDIPPGGDSAAGFGQTGRSSRGETAIGGGGFGSGLLGSNLDEDEKSPNTFGAFARAPTAGHGVALMAAMGAYGPIHAGARGDKHRIGTDGDGHPINSAHISALAYFYENSDKDGPLLFEGFYPNPSPQIDTAPVHLSWDGGVSHPFLDGQRQGYWRWWAEVPYLVPGGGPVPPNNFVPTPTGGPPSGPGGPSPPTPGGPVPPVPGPKTPKRPGGGPPTGGPSGPTTGGKPRPPQGPITPSGRRTYGRPITPNPGGKRFPNRPPWPPTRPGTTNPTTPGRGGTKPGGPTTPGRGICSKPQTPRRNPNAPGTGGAQRGPTKPGGVTPPRVFGPTYPRGSGTTGGAHHPDPASFKPEPVPPTEKAELRHGEIIPSGDGGAGGGGTDVKDPREHLGRLSGIDPVSQLPYEVPGLVERVGGDTRDSSALYTIFHPMAEGFVSLNFRPQLTVNGYPNFERNPQIPSSVFRLDEAVRPQVLTMRAWGGQSLHTGEWKPVENPSLSRARGGTGDGGVIFSPPRFELEDYYGINSDANVDDVTSARSTQGYVLAAPGVAFALGKPNPDGTLQANAIRLRQAVGETGEPMVIEHNEAEVLKAYDDGTDVIVELAQGGNGAVLLPSGTTAQRPATPVLGMIRGNTSGTTDALEFYDGVAADWVTLDINAPPGPLAIAKDINASNVVRFTVTADAQSQINEKYRFDLYDPTGTVVVLEKQITSKDGGSSRLRDKWVEFSTDEQSFAGYTPAPAETFWIALAQLGDSDNTETAKVEL